MTWFQVVEYTFIGVAYAGVWAAVFAWLMTKGTDPGRPVWQSLLAIAFLLTWFIGGIAVAVKLSMGG